MKQAIFVTVSVVLHAGFMIGLAADVPSVQSGASMPTTVQVRIVGAASPRAAAPAARPRPAPPQQTAKMKETEPAPKKMMEPQPEPPTETVAEESMGADVASSGGVASEKEPEQPSGGLGHGAGLSEAASESQARGAELDIRTFVKPRYTLPARKAGYKANFVADVLVASDGRAKEVRFDQDILYGMDERIIQAIKRAEFKPATNRLGIAIESWVRIPFHLDMSE